MQFVNIYRITSLLVLLFMIRSGVQCQKLKSWLGRDRFVGGVEPPGRNFAILANVNGLLFLHAGLQGSDYLHDMHVFDPVSLEWLEITNIVTGDYPSGRMSHAYCVINDLMYIFGGRDYSGNYLNDLYVLDPSNLQIKDLTNIAQGQIPSGRGGAQFAAINSRIYMFGGWQQSGDFFNDLFVLDVPTLTWENRTKDASGSIPSPRTSHGILSYDGKIYVFGGYSFPEVRNDLYVLDPATFVWTRLVTQAPAGGAPSPRRDIAFFAFEGGLFVFGGKDAQDASGVVRDDLYRLDPKALVWARLSYDGAAPLARGAASVALVGAHAYIFGGFVTSGATTSYLKHMQRLDVDSLTWVDVSDSLHPAPSHPRSCHAVASDGNRYIYSFGGSLGAASYIANFERFDQNTFSWGALPGDDSSQVTPSHSPSPRAFHGMAYVKEMDVLYVFGGWGSSGFLGDLFAFEIAKMTWTNLTSNMKGAVPLPTKGHGFTYSGSFLYTFGGFTESAGFSNHLYRLNPRDLEWADLSTMAHGSFPDARSYHGFTALKGKLYIFGGWSASDFLNDLMVFDPITSLWTDLTDRVGGKSPMARAYHGLASLGEYLFVFAGWSTSGLLNDLHRFDPQLLLWEKLSESISGNVPEPRYCNQLISVSRYLFSSGGVNNSDSVIDGLDLIPTPIIRKWPESNFLHAYMVTVYDWDIVTVDFNSSNVLMSPLVLCTRGLPCALHLSGQGRGRLSRLEAGHISCTRSSGCVSVVIDTIAFDCKDLISEIPVITLDGTYLQVTNSSFQSCTSMSDGSIVQGLSESRIRIASSRFQDIHSLEAGGAISVVGAHLEVFFSEFYNCSSEMGGGAISALNFSCSRSAGIRSTIDIQLTWFRECISRAEGGAIKSISGVVRVSQSKFLGCSAKSGGGAIEARAGTFNDSFVVMDSVFENNSANGYGGGAISLSNTASILASLTFNGNRAMHGGGGAILWEGTEAALACGPGYFLSRGVQSSCHACAEGKYQSGVSVLSESDCLSCIPGSYSAQAASVCYLCASGTYFTGFGASSASSCVRCQEGTFQTGLGINVSSNCEMCGMGTYSSQPGVSVCSLCEAGKYSSVIQATSVAVCSSLCPAGYYSVQGSSSCLQCDPGTYSSVSGGTSLLSCNGCEPGTYAHNATATMCDSCPIGKFSSHAASFCLDCALGSFSSSISTVQCNNCRSGTYSDRPGSTVCKDCNAGNVSGPVENDFVTVQCVSTRNDSLCTLNNRCLSAGCTTGMLGRFVSGEVYSNNEEMVITLVSNQRATILLTFLSFSSEPQYDYLTISSCANISCEEPQSSTTVSGLSLPEPINSSTGIMKIFWSSEVCCPKPSSICFCDDTGKAKILTGWLAQYSILGASACTETSQASNFSLPFRNTSSEASNFSLPFRNTSSDYHLERFTRQKTTSSAEMSFMEVHKLKTAHGFASIMSRPPNYLHPSVPFSMQSLITWKCGSKKSSSCPFLKKSEWPPGLSSAQSRMSKRRAGLETLLATDFPICGNSNEARYGNCIASSYTKLRVVGLPSSENPAYPGISFSLNVLKLDAYNEIIITDSSSIIQMFAVHSKDIEIGGASAPTILGNSIIRMSNGQANFSIAIKPTYSSAKNALAPFVIQSSFVFFNGLDSYSYNDGRFILMESDMEEIAFSNGSSVCPIGFILSFDGTDGSGSSRQGKCSFCNPGTYSVSPLFSTTSSGDPSCLDCPVNANCSSGGSTVSFSQGDWIISNGIYLLTKCPKGYELFNTIGGVFSQAAQHCVLCPATYYCDGTTSKYSCPSGSFSLPGSNSSRDCRSAIFVQVVISLSESISGFNVDKQVRFTKALAAACGAAEDVIILQSISEARRVTGSALQVKAQVATDTLDQARQITQKLDSNILNTELYKQGLSSGKLDSVQIPMSEGNNNAGNTSTIGIILGSVLGFLTFITLSLSGFYAYILYDRRNKEALWRIQPKELKFASPAIVLGRGTFGVVLQAEYRGTPVAVKRVLPSKDMDRTPSPEVTFAKSFASQTSTPQDTVIDVTGTAARQQRPNPRVSFTFNGDANNHEGNDHNIVREISSEPPTAVVGFQGQSTSFKTMSSFRESKRKNTTKTSEIFESWKTDNKVFKSSSTFSFYTPTSSLNQGSTASFLACCGGISEREYRKGLIVNFVDEMCLLSKLRHPCITTVMGAVIGDKKGTEPQLVMELMRHGSLFDLLHNDTMVLEGDILIGVMRDIVSGMRFLHAADPPVIHGDLKAANVLIDENFKAKVSDFGLSQKKQLGMVGTPFWMAPELFCGKTCSKESDIYAFGIMLYEIFSRKIPYENEDPESVLAQIKAGSGKRPNIPEGCPPLVEAMMIECWHQDPTVRPTFENLGCRVSIVDLEVFTDLVLEKIQKKKDMVAVANRASRTNTVLHDVFPKHIAEALVAGTKIEPESKEVVTIFFSDIVGFTVISSTLPPEKVSFMLDRLYQKFDELSYLNGVFKVETIGDAWMGVTNLVEDQPNDHAARIAQFAISAMKAARETTIDEDDPSLGCVNLRVGFHSGPVVANVVGKRSPRYCLFGDTVNTASRMESNSEAGKIHCSERAASILREQAPDIQLEPRGKINVKGKGEMLTFWVLG